MARDESLALPAPYPEPDQQRRAASSLEGVFLNPASTRVIHYSCESLYTPFMNPTTGPSPLPILAFDQ